MRMKPVWVILAVILPLTLVAQKKFTVAGKITGVKSGKIFLSYGGVDGGFVRDSSVIRNSKFTFTGNINEPTEAYCMLEDGSGGMNENNSVTVYLEPGNLKLNINTAHFSDARLSGSKTELEKQELEKRLQPIHERMKPVLERLREAGEKYRKAVTEKRSEAELDSLKYADAAIREEYDVFQKEISDVHARFFSDYPQSYVTLSRMRFYMSSLSLDSLDRYYSRFTPEMKNSRVGKELYSDIEKLRGGSPGSLAKNFTATDIDGEILSLSDFHGQYVLLDFWASWCVPCRKGNPHLKELYKKYHQSGIEFIGISDDDGKPDAWRKAVEKDGLPWKHVLRGLDWESIRSRQFNENDISEKYGIRTLPTKILIDKSGYIIGRYGESEEELDSKLKEIFSF